MSFLLAMPSRASSKRKRVHPGSWHRRLRSQGQGARHRAEIPGDPQGPGVRARRRARGHRASGSETSARPSGKAHAKRAEDREVSSTIEVARPATRSANQQCAHATALNRASSTLGEALWSPPMRNFLSTPRRLTCMGISRVIVRAGRSVAARPVEAGSLNARRLARPTCIGMLNLSVGKGRAAD